MTKLLVVIFSAGIDPWLTIEREGQMKTFGGRSYDSAQMVWIEANPLLDKKPQYLALNWLVGQSHRLFEDRRSRNLYRRLLSQAVSFASNFLSRRMLTGSRVVSQSNRIGNRITLAHPSHYLLQTSRTLEAFRYSLGNFEFDFLLRIASTTYADIPRFLATLNSLEPETTYSGTIYKKHRINIIGGSSILMSRDVVAALVENEKHWSFDIFEDIAIGKVIAEREIAVAKSLQRIDVRDTNLSQIREDALSSNPPFIYRCKVDHPWTIDSQPVVTLMRKLDRVLT